MGSLDPAGPVAERIEDLWWFMFWVGTAVFVLFAALLVVALVRPRAESPAGEPRTLRRWVVLGGVVLPTVVLIAVVALTLAVMRSTIVLEQDSADEATVIDVVGHRWWYEVHYPDGEVTVRDVLHLPVGEPVRLRLTSADVIHSFWVPELAGKMDMLPDGVNELVLVADRPGIFTARCAEFCGLHHTDMKLVVVAESDERFAAWLEDQR